MVGIGVNKKSIPILGSFPLTNLVSERVLGFEAVILGIFLLSDSIIILRTEIETNQQQYRSR